MNSATSIGFELAGVKDAGVKVCIQEGGNKEFYPVSTAVSHLVSCQEIVIRYY